VIFIPHLAQLTTGPGSECHELFGFQYPNFESQVDALSKLSRHDILDFENTMVCQVIRREPIKSQSLVSMVGNPTYDGRRLHEKALVKRGKYRKKKG
jgi:hypothetical protein